MLLGLVSASLYAADTIIYVSPEADGEALANAVVAAREYHRLHGKYAEIRLTSGIYRLYEPLCLRPEDSGLQLVGSGDTHLTGSVQVKGWKKTGRCYEADVPDFNGRPFDFRQIWVNGRKAVRARSVSDWDKMPSILNYDKKNRILWVPKRAVMQVMKEKKENSKLNLQDNRYEGLELVLHQMWEIGILRVKDIRVEGDSAAVIFHNPEARLQFSHPWPSPMYHSRHDSPFFFVNSLSLLDKPGELYHNIRTGKLYYMPRKGEDMSTADVEVPVLETLVKITGVLDRKVSNICFDSIDFNYTTWMRPSYKGHVPLQAGMYLTEAYKLHPQIDRQNNHKLDNQGWLGRAEAAIEVDNADRIDFLNCRLEHLGGSGLDYVSGCHYGKTFNCIFRDIALNGFVDGSFSPEGQEAHLPYCPRDVRVVCSHQAVLHNQFSNIANEDWGCVAIAAGYVSNINIEYNDVHDISYTGISLGWGWNRDSVCMHDNYVAYNHIYNYARHMYDCAGIYTLGNQPGTVIEYNQVSDIAHPSYVHDPDHWFYLYTDEGSSNITLRNNWTPSEKYLKNATGPGNIWDNNGPQAPHNTIK